MKRVKVYISHSIRGIGGSKATKETIDTNSQKALEFVIYMRKVFPNIDFYCPAEHEDWIQKALNKEIITIDDILEIDCDIVTECHILLVYCPDQYLSNGMLQEIYRAQSDGISLIIAESFYYASSCLNLELERMMVG